MAKYFELRAVVFVVAAAVPAGVALGQTTGISHPDEIPVTTSPEGIAQPVIYETPARGVVEMPAVPAEAIARPAQPEAPVIRASVAQPAMAQPSMIQPSMTQEYDSRAVSDASGASSQAPQMMKMRTSANDPDAGIVARVPGGGNQLPAGAMLHIRLRQGLTTSGTAPGTLFTAALIDAVERDGHVLLPAGATVEGKVTEVHGGKHSSGDASIHLTPVSVTLPDGTRYPLHAQVIDSSLYRTTKVDEEGTISHKNHGKGTFATLGLATGAGAAAGGVFGGWPGAIVGGAVGAGISTVVWLRQDRQADLPAGTEIVLGLTAPLTVGTE